MCELTVKAHFYFTLDDFNNGLSTLNFKERNYFMHNTYSSINIQMN